MESLSVSAAPQDTLSSLSSVSAPVDSPPSLSAPVNSLSSLPSAPQDNNMDSLSVSSATTVSSPPLSTPLASLASDKMDPVSVSSVSSPPVSTPVDSLSSVSTLPSLPCPSSGDDYLDSLSLRRTSLSVPCPPGDERDCLRRASVSSACSSACSEELMGSQSRRWLADLLRAESVDGEDEPVTVGRDGLFVDYHFPLGELEMNKGVTWRRPKELVSSPHFIFDGATRLDIIQGKLNDCWLLSAIASLSIHHSLFQKVVPPGQDFGENYSGCFTFKFWQYGDWVDVRIDDLLPTRGKRLIYLSSPQKHEFWSSLLEKAYAKLKGGYRALDMGFPHEAMVDMTGGVAEVLTVSNLPRNLLGFLQGLLSKGALINCANCQGRLEERSELGIMFRHAYSLTAVEKVETSQGSVDLVRLLNPWGNTEWEGPWSDCRSPEWSTVSPLEQQRLDRVSREDGEFWMSVSDFRQNFELMEVCHLSEAVGQSASSVRPWCCVSHHGNWVPGVSAGGPAHSGSFSSNPQFLLQLSVVHSSSNSCSFVLSLMQKHQRRKGVELATALHIYKAHPQNTYLSPSDLSVAGPLLCSPQFSSRREVVLRNVLPPGRYIIIPATAKPDQEGAFLLRILTEKSQDSSAHQPAANPDLSSVKEPSYPHLAALPSPKTTRRLFNKHANKKGFCKPLHLHNFLKEALQSGVLSGSAKLLSLEHCKSLVVLMDTQGMAKLSWADFQSLWDKIRRWTDIFLVFDKNKTQRLEYQEVEPALKAAGISVDELVMQLVGLRYTEPDLTISYPGFLFLLLKLESMIHKFQAYDVVGMGAITVSYRQWLQMTMYS